MRCDEVTRELLRPAGEREYGRLADHLAHCSSCARRVEDANRLDRLWDATRPVEPSAETWDALWANLSTAIQGSTVSAVPGAIANPNAETEVNLGRLPMGSSGARATPWHLPRGRSSTANASVSIFQPNLNAADSTGMTAVSDAGAATGFSRRKRSWQRLGIGLAIVSAQAAAVLLAVLLAGNGPGPDPLALKTELASSNSTPNSISNPDSTPVPVELVVRDQRVEIDEGRVVLIRTSDADSESVAAVEVVDLTIEESAPGFFLPPVDLWLTMFNAFEGMANPIVAMQQ
jgi:hypothetical protein